MLIKDKLLAKFVSKAIELETHELEVEYKDGYEEIIILNQALKKRSICKIVYVR